MSYDLKKNKSNLIEYVKVHHYNELFYNLLLKK